MNDPVRLRDMPDNPSASDLGAVSDARYSYDVSKGAALLSASVAGAVAAGGVAKVGLLKVGLSVIGVAGLVVVGYLVLSRETARSPLPAVAHTVVVASASAPPPDVTPPVVPSPAVQDYATAPAPLPSARVPVPRTTTSTPAPSGTLAEETQSLAKIRRTASSDPATALTMIDDANQRFSRGVFREEREAIAVGALAKLGRAADAKARGQKFLSTYPKSAFATQVRQNSGL